MYLLFKDLLKTYENNKQFVAHDLDAKAILLPVAHKIQHAQIDITINQNGEFLRARPIDKEKCRVIIPVNEDSANKGNNIVSHPLEEKLKYMAGDYQVYTGIDNVKEHQQYLKELTKWSDSKFTCDQVDAIRKYIEKGSVIKDLIEAKILVCEDGMLTNDKIQSQNQIDAFVVFSVENNEGEEPAVYRNRRVMDLFTQYYLDIKSNDIGLDYITGEYAPICRKHPREIIRDGDMGKLISSNDDIDFTYRGRFSSSDEVATMGYESSQMAHHALKWLIDKQGFSKANCTMVAWDTSGGNIKSPFFETDGIFDDEEPTEAFTNEAYATKLRLAMNSYYSKLNPNASISFVILELITKGRLAVKYYRNIGIDEYMNNISYWQTTCFWKHNYFKDGKLSSYIGAPALNKIARLVTGGHNEKVEKNMIEELLPCVIERKDMPVDIVRLAINQISNPLSFKDKYEYGDALSIACALVRKYRKDKFKEEWNMSLNQDTRDRNYLYGRLLGAAQKLEEFALKNNGTNQRVTNAENLHQQFSKTPYQTWQVIYDRLLPYILQLKGKGKDYHHKVILEILQMFDPDEFVKKQPLNGLYLLGYSSQMLSYYKKSDKHNEEMQEETDYEIDTNEKESK